MAGKLSLISRKINSFNEGIQRGWDIEDSTPVLSHAKLMGASKKIERHLEVKYS